MEDCCLCFSNIALCTVFLPGKDFPCISHRHRKARWYLFQVTLRLSAFPKLQFLCCLFTLLPCLLIFSGNFNCKDNEVVVKMNKNHVPYIFWLLSQFCYQSLRIILPPPPIAGALFPFDFSHLGTTCSFPCHPMGHSYLIPSAFELLSVFVRLLV